MPEVNKPNYIIKIAFLLCVKCSDYRGSWFLFLRRLLKAQLTQLVPMLELGLGLGKNVTVSDI